MGKRVITCVLFSINTDSKVAK